MKNALIIAFLIFSTIASATDYYISSSGNDANNGLSSSTPWKTIAKVNSSFSTLKPGDRILFNRGDIFYGTITIYKSVSAGNPITIGAYGTGEGPIITGFTTISGWTNEGSGIYSRTVSCESNPNFITINGTQYAMGRFPNVGTNLIIDSHSTNVSITDADLNSSITNWSGAEVVIRKNEYIMDRCKITNHAASTLNYTDASNSEDASDGYYYFIQNDLRTLDQFGEWYYNGTKLYVYFGSGTPSNYTIKVPTLNRLVYVTSPYITIDGPSFTGANNEVIFFYGADYGIVKNCDIDFSGGVGIWMESANGLIDNNFINHVNQEGILVLKNNTNITNTTIKNIGVIEGIGAVGSHTTGINIQAGGGLIQYNVIDSVGGGGIRFGGVGTTGVSIKNNFISNFSICMNDKGGIATEGNWDNHTFNSQGVIDKNIVLNGIGNPGKSSYDILAQGIYLDSYSSGITVTNNSVANCKGSGLYSSNSSYITLQNNTCYNNKYAIAFLEWGSSDVVLNNTMVDNIFFAKGSTDLTLEFESQSGTIGSFGTTDRNYYARPIDDNSTIYTYEGGKSINTFRTLASWQSYTGQDANSHKSPISMTNTNDIRFEYNASKTNKVIVLNQPMIDVKGLKYANSITLLPFTSVILMVDPNPSQPVLPIYTSSAVENTTPSLLEINYNVSLTNIVPASSAFTVHVNSVIRTVNSVAISGTKVQLTLASPVVYGDIITVDYIKPLTNPLQTTSGGQASSFSSQTVTNNVAPPTPPIYINSSIENATPSLIELVYSLSLASIIPLTSAFTVKVNSVIRSVSSVAISGTKVQLTLTSPVVYGDIITADYTKPSTNPLQTTPGGQAASFIAQSVTNNVASLTLPTYVSSSIENATPAILVMTYNMALVNLIPAVSAFSVKVNSVVRTISSVAISGTKVQLTLSSPVVYGDIITVDYIKPSINPLQTTSGGQAASFVSKSVTNNVASLTLPAYVSSSIENATPSLLVMTYNMALANLVPTPSAFSVLVNSVVRTVTAVVISGTKVQLTLASPIFSGDVVTLTYVKPTSNPLQTASGAIAANINNQPVINNCINFAPTAVITSPIANSSFPASSNITITANASDADGFVTLVEFFCGSIKIGSKAIAPYLFTWNNVVAGNYTLTVVATDNLNAKTISSAVSISVINGSTYINQPPVIKISNPLKGSRYFTNSTITIDAIASDTDGSISKVEFYNGTIKLVELTSAPYTYTLKDVKTGTYSITAIATDNLNGTTVSSPVEFVVGTNIKYDANSEIINLYPNPSDGHFSIKFINPLQNDKSEIIITDLAGKQVYNGVVLKEETLKQFDLSNSKDGIYIMMIKNKEILVTKKIIKN